MKNMFEIAATNLKIARERGDPKDQPLFNKLQLGDTVFVQNHVRGPFDPKYIDYRVISLKGNQVEVQPENGGPTEMKHITHVTYILPADRHINQLPDYPTFGRKTTVRMNPDYIPDLYWKVANTYHTTSIGYAETQCTTVSVHFIAVDTRSNARRGAYGEWCRTSLNTKTTTSQSKRDLTVCSVIPIT